MFSKHFENTSREEVLYQDGKHHTASSRIHTISSERKGKERLDEPGFSLSSARAGQSKEIPFSSTYKEQK